MDELVFCHPPMHKMSSQDGVHPSALQFILRTVLNLALCPLVEIRGAAARMPLDAAPPHAVICFVNKRRIDGDGELQRHMPEYLKVWHMFLSPAERK